MKRKVCLAVALTALVAMGWLRSYEVLPTRAAWAGKANGDPDYGGVGQVFTANFDSITEVSLFTGSLGAGQNYSMEVRDAETNVLIAHRYNKPPPGDHRWLEFDSIVPDGKFQRGRQYYVKFTRPSDSINFYYQEISGGGPYGYGYMFVPGQQPPIPLSQDLCSRVYGKARVGDEFAVQSNVAWTTSVPGHETIPYMSPAAWDACIARESAVGVKYDKIGYGLWAYVQRSGPSQFVWGWMDTLITSFANHGVRPIMSFRGTPNWATCAMFNPNYAGWRPAGGAIPKNLYEPVRAGDSVNPDNWYAKYIYEFVRRYGPKGLAFNGSQSGTFWMDHDGVFPYLPILLFEGFPEVTLSLGYPDVDSGGYWRLDTTWCTTPTGWDCGEFLRDSVYRDTIVAHGGNGLFPRRSSLGNFGDTILNCHSRGAHSTSKCNT